MIAVMEIAEYEDADPAVQGSLHVLDASPVAIFVLADLLSQAEILFQKPLHLVHGEQIVAPARGRSDDGGPSPVAHRPDGATGNAQGLAHLESTRGAGRLVHERF